MKKGIKVGIITLLCGMNSYVLGINVPFKSRDAIIKALRENTPIAFGSYGQDILEKIKENKASKLQVWEQITQSIDVFVRKNYTTSVKEAYEALLEINKSMLNIINSLFADYRPLGGSGAMKIDQELIRQVTQLRDKALSLHKDPALAKMMELKFVSIFSVGKRETANIVSQFGAVLAQLLQRLYESLAQHLYASKPATSAQKPSSIRPPVVPTNPAAQPIINQLDRLFSISFKNRNSQWKTTFEIAIKKLEVIDKALAEQYRTRYLTELEENL